MIPIQNLYYMLSYTFRTLRDNGFKRVATEEFANATELCAAILTNGIVALIKRGLGRTYVNRRESLSSLRGRIDITDSIKTRTMLNRKMVCEYEEFSVNSYMNRIIKTTIELLLRSRISTERKRTLRNYTFYFKDVDVLDIHSIDWHMQYHRNNSVYRVLISVCCLIIKGLLQTQSDGSVYLMDFFDERRMDKIYETFLFEYFKKEFPQITTTRSQIRWALDDECSELLPVMQSDMILTFRDKTLIIDAKYYAHSTRSQFDKPKLYSNNLYQIFTYVKNKSMEYQDRKQDVSGMLLYAKTDEIVWPDHEYRMSGNKISAKTLDLNCSSSEIDRQLRHLIENHFGCFDANNKDKCNMEEQTMI